MSGLFKTPKAPKPDPKLIAAQERAEARAEAAEQSLQEQISARRGLGALVACVCCYRLVEFKAR